MKNLSKESGLEIELDDTRLVYDKNVFGVESATRTYEDAQDVYLEKNAPAQDLYYMYRYFEARDDEELFESNKAEYDITVLKPGKVGPEMIKTVGHYHATVPDTNITYPEVYEVIEGEITYLMQTMPDQNNEVDVLIVEARAGDKVVVPPNYGHISINRGDSVAVSANIQRRDLPASANYDAFKEKNGAALYYDGQNWIENFNYTVRNKAIGAPTVKPEWGLGNEPIYTSFVKDPEKFKWLIKPQDYEF